MVEVVRVELTTSTFVELSQIKLHPPGQGRTPSTGNVFNTYKPIENSQDYFEYVDQKLIYNLFPNQK